MSGHNKWSSIKHRKGAQDAKRGKLFTKLIKELTIAAREGGGDPMGNPRLRTAIAGAKAASMPKDNIDRAIKKGTGELDGDQMEEGIYEGYGPGGVAVLIEIVTDNRNRTTADIRHCLSKNNGNLGENGCVGWMFDRRGQITIEGDNLDEDKLMEAGLELEGFEDLEMGDGEATIYTELAQLYQIREGLEAAGYNVTGAQLAYVPQNRVKIEGKKAEQMIRLIDMLEENEDVTNVYANFEIDDAEMERIMGE
jgi:YebC/PmpR family DNA-binding regulatory protein